MKTKGLAGVWPFWQSFCKTQVNRIRHEWMEVLSRTPANFFCVCPWNAISVHFITHVDSLFWSCRVAGSSPVRLGTCSRFAGPCMCKRKVSAGCKCVVNYIQEAILLRFVLLPYACIRHFAQQASSNGHWWNDWTPTTTKKRFKDFPCDSFHSVSCPVWFGVWPAQKLGAWNVSLPEQYLPIVEWFF